MKNREIKFRGIDLISGKWVIGSGCVYDEENDIYQIIYRQGINLSHHTEIKKETFGEFTGLYDKNGTPIYDGDIVKWVHGEGNGRTDCGKGTNYIGYDESGGEFGLFKNGEYTYKPLNIFRWNHDSIEVIGNVFNNPELL